MPDQSLSVAAGSSENGSRIPKGESGSIDSGLPSGILRFISVSASGSSDDSWSRVWKLTLEGGLSAGFSRGLVESGSNGIVIESKVLEGEPEVDWVVCLGVSCGGLHTIDCNVDTIMESVVSVINIWT